MKVWRFYCWDMTFKAVLWDKLKGARCTEPVKSRVPSMKMLWKSQGFLVPQQQKLGTRVRVQLCIQLNLSTMATLGTEESGLCWEVETRVNVWTVHQKNGRVREVAISAGSTVHFITKDFLNVTQSYTCEGIQMCSESSHNFQEIVLWWKIFSCNAKWISNLTFAKLSTVSVSFCDILKNKMGP